MIPALRSLSRVARLRALVARPLAFEVLRSPRLRRLLARRRQGATVEGATVDETVGALLALDDLKGDTSIAGVPPQRAREMFAEGIACIEASAPSGLRTVDLAYPGAAGPLRARLYVPDGLTAPSPGILYAHGGGFMTCDLETHDVFCRRLALGARARVVSIEYRLAPEHPYPAAIDDGIAAYRWLVDAAPSLGIDPESLAVAGESAGGHMSAVLSQELRHAPTPPRLQVLIYPALDSTCSAPSHRELAEGWLLTASMIDVFYSSYFRTQPEARRLPRGSPIFAETLGGLPPALVYSAGFDPLKDEALDYAERLRRDGVPVRHHRFPTLVHGFITMTGVSFTSRIACERIATEVGEALRAGVRPV